MIPFSVEFEEEYAAVKGDPEQLKALMDETKNCKSALPKIIRAGYTELSLQSYVLHDSSAHHLPLYGSSVHNPSHMTHPYMTHPPTELSLQLCVHRGWVWAVGFGPLVRTVRRRL